MSAQTIDILDVKYYTEAEQDTVCIGICDGVNEIPAYTTLQNESSWDACIHNKEQNIFRFVPVDHNIPIVTPQGEKKKRCDGMIIMPSKSTLIFVELKNRHTGGWIPEGLKQLEATISYFYEKYTERSFVHRKAYLCNSIHPRFSYSHREQMQEFYSKYKFRIFIQYDIVL